MMAAKKTSLKKTPPKKTGSKAKATKKMPQKKKTTPMKTVAREAAPKKSVEKKASSTKKALKKAALKMKIAAKRSDKIGESMAKKDFGKKETISKSSEERNARAARRSLYNPLTTSASVPDILAASGSRPSPKEAVVDVAMEEASEVACCICRFWNFGGTSMIFISSWSWKTPLSWTS